MSPAIPKVKAVKTPPTSLSTVVSGANKPINKAQVTHLSGFLSHRRLVSLAIPAVAAAFCSALFTTANAYWVSRLLGPDALAAVAFSFFWCWALLALSEVLGTGLISLASQHHGRKDSASAATIAGQALSLGLMLGALVALLVPPLLPRLLTSLSLHQATFAFALPYLTIAIFATPIIVANVIVDALLKASGDTTTPFKLTAISLVGAVILTPALITGFGPLPSLGILGAAYSLVITQGTAALLGIIIGYRRHLLNFSLPTIAVSKSIVKIGLPAATTGLTIAAGYIVITGFLAPYGSTGLAALGIGDQIETWLFIISLGLAEVVSAAVGQNIGAGDIKAAKKTTTQAIIIALFIGLATCILSYIFAPLLASQFTDDPRVLSEAVRYMRITAIAQVFFCAELVLDGAMSGAGYTVKPMIISTLITTARIPVAFFAISQFGLTGLWVTLTLTALVRSLALFALWRTDSWAKQITITTPDPVSSKPLASKAVLDGI